MKRKRSTLPENNLEEARRNLVYEDTDGPIRYSLRIRQRSTNSTHGAQDLVFVLKFSEEGARGKKLITILNHIYQALNGLVERLRQLYPNGDNEERIVFLAIESPAFASNIYSGKNIPL